MEQEDSSRVGRAFARVYLILCLIYMVWIMWHLLLPEHRRQQMKLRLLLSCAQVTNRLARHAGAASLRREAETGVEDYGLPYRLSVARDWLEDAYDRARSVTV